MSVSIKIVLTDRDTKKQMRPIKMILNFRAKNLCFSCLKLSQVFLNRIVESLCQPLLK